MIVIDGSSGEGGGQILRTSLSLASLTGKPFEIVEIRARRSKFGLGAQHVTAVRAAAEICGAEVKGDYEGATRLVFKPGAIKAGSYTFDVAGVRASAGSANLVLQTVIWPLAFADRPSKVVIKGGTHVPHAPTSNYIDEIFLPALARMGLLCYYDVPRRGYYPIGGGEVHLEIRPVEALQPFTAVDRPDPLELQLTSAVSNLPVSIAQRQMTAGLESLSRVLPPGRTPLQSIEEYPSSGKGTVFFIKAAFGGAHAGFQSLGERGKPAEKVASDACDEFQDYLASGKAIDPHLADQLIIPIALALGTSTFTTSRITNHLLTNIAVVQRFLPVRFHVSAPLGEPGEVRCG